MEFVVISREALQFVDPLNPKGNLTTTTDPYKVHPIPKPINNRDIGWIFSFWAFERANVPSPDKPKVSSGAFLSYP
jgi:hypothetical protein